MRNPNPNFVFPIMMNLAPFWKLYLQVQVLTAVSKMEQDSRPTRYYVIIGLNSSECQLEISREMMCTFFNLLNDLNSLEIEKTLMDWMLPGPPLRSPSPYIFCMYIVGYRSSLLSSSKVGSHNGMSCPQVESWYRIARTLLFL